MVRCTEDEKVGVEGRGEGGEGEGGKLVGGREISFMLSNDPLSFHDLIKTKQTINKRERERKPCFGGLLLLSI